MAVYTPDGPEASLAAKRAASKVSADPAHGSCAVVAARSGDFPAAMRNADQEFEHLLREEWRREIVRRTRGSKLRVMQSRRRVTTVRRRAREHRSRSRRSSSRGSPREPDPPHDVVPAVAA